MAVAERIYFFRLLRNFTQKALGTAVGFSEKGADVRITQYESGDRTPRAEVINALAQTLDVSPYALNVPDIDSRVGLMHTLFTLEDVYGLRMVQEGGVPTLQVNVRQGQNAIALNEMLCAWMEQSEKYRLGEITKEEYDYWRYHYPETDTTRRWVHIPHFDDVLEGTKKPPKQRAKRKTQDK